jgi:antitoxin CptB
MSTADHDLRLRKLKYRAWHRGIREADLILGPFVDENARSLNPSQLDELERLLEAPDQQLYGWITGAPAPQQLEGEMLAMIRSFLPAPLTGA